MKKKYKKIPISEFISSKKLQQIGKLISRISDVDTTYDKIESILDKDFKVKALGTNRIVLVHRDKKYKDLIFKVAGDKHGIEANYREFYNGDLDHALTYSYSISTDGIFIVQEKVKTMTSDDVKDYKKEIRKMLHHLSKKILLVDCKLSNFKNFGLRDNDEVCLLDHGDTVPLKKCQDDNIVNIDEESSVSLHCKRYKDITSGRLKTCGGKLEYSKNFDYLVCQKCGAAMPVHDAYKEIYGEDTDNINMTKDLIKNLDFDPYEWKEEVKKYCIDTMSNVNINNNKKGEITMKTKIINNQECKQLKGFWVPEDVLSSPKYVMFISAIKTNQMKPGELFEQLNLDPEEYKVRSDDHVSEDWNKYIPTIVNNIIKRLQAAVNNSESNLCIKYDELNTDEFVIDNKHKERAIFLALKNNSSELMDHVSKIIYTISSFNFSLVYDDGIEELDDDKIDTTSIVDDIINEVDVEEIKNLSDYDYEKIAIKVLIEITNSQDRKNIPSLHKYTVSVPVSKIGAIFVDNNDTYDEVFSDNKLFKLVGDNKVQYYAEHICEFLETYCNNYLNVLFIDNIKDLETGKTTLRFVFNDTNDSDTDDEEEYVEYEEVSDINNEVSESDTDIPEDDDDDSADIKPSPVNNVIEDVINDEDTEEDEDDFDDDDDDSESDSDYETIIDIIEKLQETDNVESTIFKDDSIELYLADISNNDNEMSKALQVLDIIESDSDFKKLSGIKRMRNTLKNDMVEYAITHVRQNQNISVDKFITDLKVEFAHKIKSCVNDMIDIAQKNTDAMKDFLSSEFMIDANAINEWSDFSWLFTSNKSEKHDQKNTTTINFDPVDIESAVNNLKSAFESIQTYVDELKTTYDKFATEFKIVENALSAIKKSI